MVEESCYSSFVFRKNEIADCREPIITWVIEEEPETELHFIIIVILNLLKLIG